MRFSKQSILRPAGLFKAMAMLALLVSGFPAKAETCELTISGNDMLQYDKSSLSVAPACDTVTLSLNHTGELPKNQMGHNWVLTGVSEWQSVAQDSMAAGADNEYVTPDDERILVSTQLIGGGESTSVTFDLAGLDRNQDYTYFCSFPGHYVTMNGTLTFD